MPSLFVLDSRREPPLSQLRLLPRLHYHFSKSSHFWNRTGLTRSLRSSSTYNNPACGCSRTCLRNWREVSGGVENIQVRLNHAELIALTGVRIKITSSVRP